VPGTSNRPSGVSSTGTVNVPLAQKSKRTSPVVFVISSPALGPPHFPGPSVPGITVGSVDEDREQAATIATIVMATAAVRLTNLERFTGGYTLVTGALDRPLTQPNSRAGGSVTYG
jgi:hypothetical protein